MESHLKHHEALLQIKRLSVDVFEVAEGQNKKTIHSLFSTGDVPARIAIAFVSDKGYTGSKTRNPYDFFYMQKVQLTPTSAKICFVKNITLTLNGSHLTSMEGDCGKHGCMKDYSRLQSCLKAENSNDCNMISYELFKGGAYISMYDLTTDSANLEIMDPAVRTGTVRLHVDFTVGLFEQINILVFSERRGTIGITPDKKIRTSFQV